MSNVHQMLVEARELIAHPSQWVKGVMSNGDGAYCSLGAVHFLGDKYGHTTRDQAFDALEKIIPHRGIVGFNDAPETTHDDVLVMFDQAIANEKTK